MARLFYGPVIKQYCYQYYGEAILKDTDFEAPNGTYCINSSFINFYTGSNDSYKQDQTQSNHLVIYTKLVIVPAIATALILGPLTDKFGRKLGLLAPLFGNCMEGLGSLLIIYFRLNPYYFIGTSLMTGLVWGNTGLVTSSYSYMQQTWVQKNGAVSE